MSTLEKDYPYPIGPYTLGELRERDQLGWRISGIVSAAMDGAAMDGLLEANIPAAPSAKLGGEAVISVRGRQLAPPKDPFKAMELRGVVWDYSLNVTTPGRTRHMFNLGTFGTVDPDPDGSLRDSLRPVIGNAGDPVELSTGELYELNEIISNKPAKEVPAESAEDV